MPKSQHATGWSAEDLREDPHAAVDKAARVEAMFTDIAPRYDLNNRLHSMWRDQAWRKRAVEMAKILPNDHVLDMACGTGDLTAMLAQEHPARTLGIDYTAAMLDIARRKATGIPIEHRPTYQKGDAMDIELEDLSMDVITIAFGIRNVAEPERAVAEFARILRPGGRLLILEFSTPSNPLIRIMNTLYTRHLMPLTAGLIAGDRSGAYRYLPRSISTFADPSALSAMLERHGFVTMEQRRLTLGLCTITHAKLTDS